MNFHASRNKFHTKGKGIMQLLESCLQDERLPCEVSCPRKQIAREEAAVAAKRKNHSFISSYLLLRMIIKKYKNIISVKHTSKTSLSIL